MDDDRILDELADQPLDEVDARALRQVRALLEAADPVPDDLVERIGFAVALDEMFDEVARLTRVPMDELAVRSDPASMRTETLTFAADRLNAMVTVNRVSVGVLRVDGWLTPPGPWTVRLRMQSGGEHEAPTDEQGRFSFDGLPEGFAQLSFHPILAPADQGVEEGANTVVTPLFQL